MEYTAYAKIKRLFVIAGVTLGVYLVIRYILPLGMPFLLSYALYCLIKTPARRLSVKRDWAMRWCMLAGIILEAAVVLLVMYLGGRWIWGLVRDWTMNGQQYLADIQMWIAELCAKADRLLGMRTGNSRLLVDKLIAKYAYPAEGQPQLVQMAGQAAKQLGHAGITLLIGFIGAIVLIFNRIGIANELKESEYYREICAVFGSVSQVAGSFIRCQAVIITCIALVCAGGLWMLGTGHAFLWGLGIAVMDAFPVLGTGTVLLPWMVISIISGEWLQAAGFFLLYMITMGIREFLEPRLLGKGLNINPFYMLMATFIGIELFGIWGILTGPLGLVMIIEILGQVEYPPKY